MFTGATCTAFAKLPEHGVFLPQFAQPRRAAFEFRDVVPPWLSTYSPVTTRFRIAKFTPNMPERGAQFRTRAPQQRDYSRT